MMCVGYVIFVGCGGSWGDQRAPLWRILAGVAESDWTEALDMDGAQAA